MKLKFEMRYWLPVALLMAPLASASSLYGEFGFTGPGVLVFNTGSDYIEFCQSLAMSGTTCATTPTATGDIAVTGTGSNSFSVLTSSVTGTIDNTTDGFPPASPYTYLPVDTPVTIDDYLALSGLPQSGWDFQANLLTLATCTTTSTQECVGPFELSSLNGNVSVTTNILGTLINETSGGDSAFDLTLTGQYNDTTIANVIAGATSSGGVFSDSWSATLTASPIPEPGTLGMLLTGVGLISVSLIRRRRSS